MAAFFNQSGSSPPRSLSDFLRHVHALPRLLPGEDLLLARKAYDGDVAARSRLVEAHLWLAYQVVQDYNARGRMLARHETLALVQQGAEALFAALSSTSKPTTRFDGDYGSFVAWARGVLQHAVSKYAERFVIRWERRVVQLEDTTGVHVEDRPTDPLRVFVRVDQSKVVHDLLATLDPLDQEVLRLRFGFRGSSLSYDEIALELQRKRLVKKRLTRQSIQQRVVRALDRLRTKVKGKRIEDFVESDRTSAVVSHPLTPDMATPPPKDLPSSTWISKTAAAIRHRVGVSKEAA